MNKAETVTMLGTLLTLKKDIETELSFSMNNFLKTNNVDHKLSRILKEEGLVTMVGGTKRKPKYEWSGIEPTIKTAEKVIEKMKTDMRGKKRTEKPKSSKVSKPTTKPKTLVGYAETKILWGLITLKTKINIKES